jgi:hypothetical protein
VNGFERADRAAAASPRGPGRFLPVRVEPPRRWALASPPGLSPYALIRSRQSQRLRMTAASIAARAQQPAMPLIGLVNGGRDRMTSPHVHQREGKIPPAAALHRLVDPDHGERL